MDRLETTAIPDRAAWVLEARELLKLAVPLAATQVAQMLILATDTAMLGHFSKDALAAAALGNTIFFMAWLLGCGLPMAVSTVIAHIQGENGSERDVRAAVRMGLWSVALSMPFFMALLFFTRDLLLLVGEDHRLA